VPDRACATRLRPTIQRAGPASAKNLVTQCWGKKEKEQCSQKSVCCSVLQCFAVSQVRSVAVCCCVMLQCVAVLCCSVLQCFAVSQARSVAVCCCVMLQCVAVLCCSVLQCFAVSQVRSASVYVIYTFIHVCHS